MKLKKIGTYKISNTKEEFLEHLKVLVKKDGKYDFNYWPEHNMVWFSTKLGIFNPFSRRILSTEIRGEFDEYDNISIYIALSRWVTLALGFYIFIGFFTSILFLSNAEYENFFTVIVFLVIVFTTIFLMALTSISHHEKFINVILKQSSKILKSDYHK